MNKKIYILSAFIILLTILGTLWYAHYQPSKYRLSSPQYASNQPSETPESIKKSEDFTNATENKEKEPKTLFELADRYYYGKPGYEQNYQKAFELFNQAYHQEEPEDCANIALGNMYYTGKGVEKDINKAFQLWDEGDACRKHLPYSVEAYNHKREYVIKNKDKEKAFLYGDQCFKRYGRTNLSCGHALTLDELDFDYNACDQGEQWYKLAAEYGHPEAMLRLATNYLVVLNYHHSCYREFNGQWSEALPKNKPEGEKWLLLAAEQGYADAMEELANMYFYGWISTDHKQAEKWFLKAAEKGKKYSMLMLARLYSGVRESGIPADYKKAYYWANQAIKNGVEEANYYLGQLYYYGKGVKKDHKKALSLFKKVKADYEYLRAGLMLQEMYLNGEGTEEDFKELEEQGLRCYYYYCTKGWIFGKENYKDADTESLWQAAFEKNDILAQIHLMRSYKGSNEDLSDILRSLIVLQEEPSDEYAKNEWLKAKQTFKEKQAKVQNIEDYNPEDITTLKQAAIFRNDTLAQRKIGAYYIKKSKKERPDYPTERFIQTKAAEWYFLAARSGDSIAQVQLASMYFWSGIGEYSEYGSPNNTPEEIYWLEKAADQGNPLATYELGDKYYHGVSFYDEMGAIYSEGFNLPYLAQNLEKAFNLYMKSAKAGYVPSMKKLSHMYEHGEYVSKDQEKAKYWEKKADKTKVIETFDDEVNSYIVFRKQQ